MLLLVFGSKKKMLFDIDYEKLVKTQQITSCCFIDDTKPKVLMRREVGAACIPNSLKITNSSWLFHLIKTKVT